MEHTFQFFKKYILERTSQFPKKLVLQHNSQFLSREIEIKLCQNYAKNILRFGIKYPNSFFLYSPFKITGIGT